MTEAPAWRRVVDLLLLVARVAWGLQLIVIGGAKLLEPRSTAAFFSTLDLPAPLFNAVAAGLTETLGGLCLALGLGARLAAVPVAGCMVVALATAHRGEWFFQAKPFPFLVVALVVLALGAGRWSLDARRAARATSTCSTPTASSPPAGGSPGA